MFKNPEKKLKVLAVIFFFVMTIISVVMAFTLGYESVYHNGMFANYATTMFKPGIFFSIILGGPLVAYVFSLVLVGLGQIFENNQSNVTSSDVSGKKYVCRKCGEVRDTIFMYCPICGEKYEE